MDFNQKVRQLLDEVVKEEDLFLVDCSISADNSIHVLVDAIKGIKVGDLMKVSRHIEHNLDREEQDFALEVSSPGLDQNFKVKEQYLKNVGRKIQVACADGSQITGNLIEVNEEDIKLSWKTREKKEVGKGKHTVVHEKTLPFSEIHQAKVVITI